MLSEDGRKDGAGSAWGVPGAGDGGCSCDAEPHLLIDEVARRENLEISDEEFDAALDAIAGMFDMHPAEVLQTIGAAGLRDQLRRDKARAMIVDSARRI